MYCRIYNIYTNCNMYNNITRKWKKNRDIQDIQDIEDIQYLLEIKLSLRYC